MSSGLNGFGIIIVISFSIYIIWNIRDESLDRLVAVRRFIRLEPIYIKPTRTKDNDFLVGSPCSTQCDLYWYYVSQVSPAQTTPLYLVPVKVRRHVRL